MICWGMSWKLESTEGEARAADRRMNDFSCLRPWYSVLSVNARGRSGKLFSASVAEPGITPVLVSHVAVKLHLVVKLQAVRENRCRRIASGWLLACLGVCRLAQWGANLPWRYSEVVWAQSRVMCSTGPCLSREFGVESLQWSLPTLPGLWNFSLIFHI